MSKLIQTTVLTCLLVLPPLTSVAQQCQSGSILAVTPAVQFTEQGDGTVTDSRTGLMWKKCSEGQTWDVGSCRGSVTNYTWKNALERVQMVNNSGGFAGHSDWRLPNIAELESIVEEQCFAPAINLTIFPNTPAASFWSSSAGEFARYINFNVGYDGMVYKGYDNSVRLVRGGQ